MQWGAKNVRVNVAMAGLQKYGTAETCWRSSR
jgi:hypothetical protein